MLEKDKLIDIIEKYNLSRIQSEDEVRSKFIVDLIEWLGYPSQFRAENFSIYGAVSGRELHAQKADFVLFDDQHFDIHNDKEGVSWVREHSLLIIEAKAPGEMPDNNWQAEFYSAWSRAVAYLYIDGKKVKGYLYTGKITNDYPIIECGISELVDNIELLQFSYDNTKRVKDIGVDHLHELVLSQYKRKLSSMHGDKIPDSQGASLLTRHIKNIKGTVENDNEFIELPFDILKQEKNIVLLADAGQGKTYTLYQIYREAEQQGYHPFFYYLRSLHEENNALFLINEDKVSIDEKAVFILDGYDEISDEKRICLANIINNIININSEILIIISSRTNMYSNQIETDHIFTINDITRHDIDEFLLKLHIDVEKWSEQIEELNLEELEKNAFYLNEMTNIWMTDGSLAQKTAIMKAIINARIKKDIDRNPEQTITLQQKIPVIIKAFERMALIMQCIQCYYLTYEQLCTLFERETQDIILFQGLWILSKDGTGSFDHNNFREYFAAESLSHMNLERVKRFVAGGAESSFIKPSWYNVISFLSSLYPREEFRQWIFDIEPELIITFEKERLNDDCCIKALKSIMEKNKKEDSWVDPNYTFLRKLVALCTNENAVGYIVKELQSKQTQRHKRNLLRCLEYFTSYYDLSDTIVSLVVEYAFDRNESNMIRSDAFEIMQAHASMFIEYIDEAVDLCKASDDEYIKCSIFKFMYSSGNAEKYIDVVIESYEKYDHQTSRYFSYKSILELILKSIQGLNAACKLMCYLLNKKLNNEYYKLFEHCCEIGIKNYDGEKNDFLLTLLEIFNGERRTLSHKCYVIIAHYIQETHTEDIFIDYIVRHQPQERCGYILSQIITCSMINGILKKIKEKSISIFIIRDIVQRLTYESEEQNKIIQETYTKYNEIIKVEPIKDYAKERLNEHQKFFDTLFDHTSFDSLVTQIQNILGNTAEISSDLIHTLLCQEEIDSKESLVDCCFAIINAIPDNKHILINEYRQYIQDWDAFCYVNAINAIQEHGVKANDKQVAFLKEYCINYLKNNNVDDILNSHDDLSMLEASAWLINKYEISCPEELAIKLIVLPPLFFDDREHDQIPQCLRKQITKDKLNDAVKSIINNNEWNEGNACALIQYCIDNEIVECKDTIISDLLKGEDSVASNYWSLEYLQTLFGIKTIVSDVLPLCDDNTLLWSISERIPNDISSSILNQKLTEEYNNSKDTKWLEQLIKHNDVNALKEYYRLASKYNTLPDMVMEPQVPTITQAIRSVASLECLHIIIDLLVLSYDSCFTDREFFGLKSSCCKAITTIARNDYDETCKELINRKKEGTCIINSVIASLLQDIGHEYRYILDSPFDFETARRLTV